MNSQINPNPSPSVSEEILLECKSIKKKFCRDYRLSLLFGAQDIAGDLLGFPTSKNRLRKKEFWAVQDISFELRRGEAIGIVGRNGGGKTTLMRILAGLIKPTGGEVVRRGRLAPMLALGAGFNPVLTGRENIYVNMAILGLSKAEIDARFDEVVAFSEIEESLDAPVQNYSTGMVARLGFACAIHTSPDILLIDEVMAVGDVAFQAKCRNRIRTMRDEGTSFIIVNHAPQLIVDTCQRAIYLKNSRCALQGEAMDVIRKYEEDLRMKSVAKPIALNPDIPASPNHSDAKIASCKWSGPEGSMVKAGQMAFLTVELEISTEQKAASLMLRIEPSVGLQHLQWKENRSDRAQAASTLVCSSKQDGFSIAHLPSGKAVFSLEFLPLCLNGGEYRYMLWLFASADGDDSKLLDLFTGYIEVGSDEVMQGSNLYQPRTWRSGSLADCIDPPFDASPRSEQPTGHQSQP